MSNATETRIRDLMDTGFTRSVALEMIAEEDAPKKRSYARNISHSADSKKLAAILSQIRKQVVHRGKLRYGAASRIASLLGLSQYSATRAIMGKITLDAPALEKLEHAIATKTPLHAVKAGSVCCDECKRPSKARGKCAFHYFRAWRRGDFTE